MTISRGRISLILIFSMLFSLFAPYAGVHAANSVSFSIRPQIDASFGTYPHWLALKSDGTVWSAGINNGGQLGDGTTTNRNNMAMVPGLTRVVQIDAAGLASTGNPSYSAALKSDGSVWLWGALDLGSYGNHSYGTVPTQITGIGKIKAISTGIRHTLALATDGTVWAWGRKMDLGIQLGLIGSAYHTTSPVKINGISNVIAVQAGNTISYFLKKDGTVWAMGDGASGKLGSGTTTDSWTPKQVQGVSNIISISATEEHILALKSDGTVWSWGRNGYGQVGDGSATSRLTPYQITNLNNVVSVSAGRYTSSAVKSDGTIWSWGYGASSLFGNGTTANSYVPVQMNVPGPMIKSNVVHAQHFAINSNNGLYISGINTNFSSISGVADSTLSTPVKSAFQIQSGPIDMAPPTVPVFTANSNLTYESVTLNWADADEGDLQGYELYLNNELIATLDYDVLSYNIAGLESDTQYKAELKSFDYSGNKSGFSVANNFTTLPDPFTPKNLVASNIAGTSATINWEIGQNIPNLSGFIVYVDGVEVGRPSATSFNITGLEELKEYTITVKARKSTGEESRLSKPFKIKTPDVTPPSVPQGLRIKKSVLNMNLIEWDKSTDNNAVKEYAVFAGETELGRSTSTNFFVTDLPAGDHLVTVKAVDSDPYNNISAPSTPLSINIPDIPKGKDNKAPTPVTNLSIVPESIDEDAAIVRWNNSKESGMYYFVEWGTGNTTTADLLDGPMVKSQLHKFTISDLMHDSNYSLSVTVVDKVANKSAPAEVSFKTLTQDKIPPSIPMGLKVTNLLPNSLKLHWFSSKDDRKMGGYKLYYTSGQGGDSVITIDDPSKKSFDMNSLLDNFDYTFRLSAVDIRGNESGLSEPLSIKTPMIDIEKPTQPIIQYANLSDNNSFSIRWSESLDNVGVAAYHVFISPKRPSMNYKDTPIAIVKSNAYTTSAGYAEAGKIYNIYIRATDAAGNASEPSGMLSKPGPAKIKDKTPPYFIKSSIIKRSSNYITWTRASDYDDGSGIQRYDVTITGVSGDNIGFNKKFVVFENDDDISDGYGCSGTVCRYTISPTMLVPSSPFKVAVSAYDKAGNKSSNDLYSTGLKAPPDTIPPEKPYNIVISDITEQSLRLSWSHPYDNTGISGYHVAYSEDSGASWILATSDRKLNPDISTYLLNGLKPGTDYRVAIWSEDTNTIPLRSCDVIGTRSTNCPSDSPAAYKQGDSMELSNLIVRTLPDLVEPTRVDPVYVYRVTNTGFTVAWEGSFDNVGVNKYSIKIYQKSRGSAPIKTFECSTDPSSLSSCDTLGEKDQRAYRFKVNRLSGKINTSESFVVTVSAVDAASNESSSSIPVTFKLDPQHNSTLGTDEHPQPDIFFNDYEHINSRFYYDTAGTPVARTMASGALISKEQKILPADITAYYNDNEQLAKITPPKIVAVPGINKQIRKSLPSIKDESSINIALYTIYLGYKPNIYRGTNTVESLTMKIDPTYNIVDNTFGTIKSYKFPIYRGVEISKEPIGITGDIVNAPTLTETGSTDISFDLQRRSLVSAQVFKDVKGTKLLKTLTKTKINTSDPSYLIEYYTSNPGDNVIIRIDNAILKSPTAVAEFEVPSDIDSNKDLPSSFVWDGRGPDGAVVKPGAYSVSVRPSSCSYEWKSKKISCPEPGVGEQKLVATLVSESKITVFPDYIESDFIQMEAGENILTWYGNTDNGTELSDGEYYLRLSVKNVRNTDPVSKTYVTKIKVEREAPSVDSISSALISLIETGGKRIRVRAEDTAPVITYNIKETLGAEGSLSVFLRPKSPSIPGFINTPAISGNNKFLVHNLIMARQAAKSFTKVPPVISNSIEKSHISVNYSVSEESQVAISVLNNEEEVIAIFEGSGKVGPNRQSWDGVLSNGTYIGSGSYTVRITATDATGKSSYMDTSLEVVNLLN